MVHFVGAGPGAPDLITVRGKKYIEEADVIIYAGSLVNAALLEDAKEGAEIYNSAKMTLEEVLEIIAAAEAEGKMTVRLHTGDSSIYGAIKEQIDALEEKKISYDVCPGVSSFCGAAAALNLEYTLPKISQSVIITRVQGKTEVPEKESLHALAAHGSTLVLFLSAGLTEKVKEELLLAGRAGSTPVALVYKATWPDEKIVRTTVDELPEAAAKAGITKTALIIVGDVLSETPDYELSKLYDKTFSTEYRQAKQ